MVASVACRETIVRFGAGFAAFCVVGMTTAIAQTGEPPATDADTAIARTRALVDPVKRCPPPAPGEIVVCSTGEEPGRLTAAERAIAGVGRAAPPKLPRAEAKAMSLDKLPYNWVSIGGRAKPGPEYNPLYEIAKRATDPDRQDVPAATPPEPSEIP